ncbi:hypothetical protein BSKO_13845 [Bryopsis sp. KO-2023]|nr:hypothetical protein BSKO_13845 [Bryopsis sp. KO-2023]
MEALASKPERSDVEKSLKQHVGFGGDEIKSDALSDIQEEKVPNTRQNILAGVHRKTPPPTKADTLESLRVKIPIDQLNNEELIDKCKRLMAEVEYLQQQVARKEEQKQAALRLLRHAKKKHVDQSAVVPTLSQAINSFKEKAGKEEDASPRSQAGSVASRAPSIAPSVMSLGKRSLAGSFAYRKPMGLRELVEPDVRLAQVLDKLSSEPVLSALEGAVDKLQKSAVNNITRGGRQ